VQGADDPHVTPENLRVVEAALKRAGVPYETLIFADDLTRRQEARESALAVSAADRVFGAAFAE